MAFEIFKTEFRSNEGGRKGEIGSGGQGEEKETEFLSVL